MGNKATVAQTPVPEWVKLCRGKEIVDAEITPEWRKAAMKKQLDDVDASLESAKADDWLPTPHGLTLGEALIGNDDIKKVLKDASVLELGSGVGNHTILLAKAGISYLLATEISEPRLDTTRKTLEQNNVKLPYDLIVANWLIISKDQLPKDRQMFDILITNPPFAASGKANRRYFIDNYILEAHKYLKQGGWIIWVQSSGADPSKSLEMLAVNGFENIKVVHGARYPWRDYYFEDQTYVAMVEKVPFGYEQERDKNIESIVVIMAQLKEYKPPSIAH